MSITQASFDNGLQSLIGRFTKDIRKIYYAMIFQTVFFLIVIGLTTFTSINQEQILWIASIIGIAGIGVVADFEHLKKTVKDAFNDLKILRKVRDILEAIPDMLSLSATPNKDRQNMAVVLRTTLKQTLLGGDPDKLMQQVKSILTSSPTPTASPPTPIG